MTKNADLNTDVNLNMNITDEPHSIAENLMEGLLIPILNSKTRVHGIEQSVQIYIDLAYLMVAERVRMIGRNGISEMRDLLDELESELEDTEVMMQPKPMHQVRDFMELSKKAS